MPFAPPDQGLSFWARSILHCGSSYNRPFDARANDGKDFWEHALLDVVVNHHPKVWTRQCKDKIDFLQHELALGEIIEKHPRAGTFKEGNPGTLKIAYSYRDLTVSHGKNRQNIVKTFSVIGKDYPPGDNGEIMARFIPVPLPNKKAGDGPYLWVDLTYPIRGIYFPVSYVAGPNYSEYCLYAGLDFTHGDRLEIVQKIRGQDQVTKHVFDPDLKYGLSALGTDVSQLTARFNVPELIKYLSLPKNNRKANSSAYIKEYVQLFNCHEVTPAPKQTITPTYLRLMTEDETLDILDVFQAETGVTAKYPAKKGPFILQVFHQISHTALGLIPYAGPFLAMGEELMYQAVVDPYQFKADNAQQYTTDVLNAFVNAAADSKGLFKGSKLREAGFELNARRKKRGLKEKDYEQHIQAIVNGKA